MSTTTRKSKSSKPERLTDKELLTLIKHFVAKLPDAGQSAFVRQVRESGKSVSGGRVREVFKSLLKPKTKKRAA